MIKEYPVSVKDYTKEEAPYIYTKYAEEFAKEQAGLEPRIAGTIACFAGQPLQHGITAKAWKKSEFVVER